MQISLLKVLQYLLNTFRETPNYLAWPIRSSMILSLSTSPASFPTPTPNSTTASQNFFHTQVPLGCPIMQPPIAWLPAQDVNKKQSSALRKLLQNSYALSIDTLILYFSLLTLHLLPQVLLLVHF